MSLKALVAVRSGSVRVENKNMRPFGDSNLLTLKIKQLQRIKLLDGIVVNSNDEEMLETAARLGCEVVKRDNYYASNSVSMSDVYQNMAENFNGDIIMYANATNPLLEDQTIINAIEAFNKNNGEFDSLNTAHLVKEFLFLDNKPINYQLDHQPRSQDLPNICALNFALNIIDRKTMIETKNVVGRAPHIFLISELEATDIDNPIDFTFSEFVFLAKTKTQEKEGF